LFTSSRLLGAAFALAVAGLASVASAATLDITYFDRSQAGAAQAALDAFRSGKSVTASKTETFEGLRAWDGARGAANPNTRVGKFTSLGGHGTGRSSVNGGTKLQVRNDDPWVWGRYNTSGVDGNWLDSNDTHGMRWQAEGLGKFNAIAFLLTDAADVGAKLSITADGETFAHRIGAQGRLANGSIQFVRILLPKAVDKLTVELRNNKLNDGFGIDNATIANVAPVPLPPAALLMLSGAAGLAALRRRRGRAAAA